MPAPLVFTHYGDPDYLAFTLAQAKASNPERRCILLGDDLNQETARSAGWEHVEYRELCSSKRDAFNARFFWIQGISHNPMKGGEDWLRFVSERFFCLEAFLINERIDSFWHFDSDTMILHDLSAYERELADSGFDAFTLCNDACPSGYIQTALIAEFCKSMIEDYEDKNFIRASLQDFRRLGPAHAYTEMEAFCRYREKCSVKTARLSSFFSDRNVWFDDCMCQDHGFQFVNAPRLGKKIKNFYSDKSGRICCQQVDGTSYEFATINCSWVSTDVYAWIASERFDCASVCVKLADSLGKSFRSYCVDLVAAVPRFLFYRSRSLFRRFGG